MFARAGTGVSARSSSSLSPSHTKHHGGSFFEEALVQVTERCRLARMASTMATVPIRHIAQPATVVRACVAPKNRVLLASGLVFGPAASAAPAVPHGAPLQCFKAHEQVALNTTRLKTMTKRGPPFSTSCLPGSSSHDPTSPSPPPTPQNKRDAAFLSCCRRQPSWTANESPGAGRHTMAHDCVLRESLSPACLGCQIMQGTCVVWRAQGPGLGMQKKPCLRRHAWRR